MRLLTSRSALPPSDPRSLRAAHQVIRDFGTAEWFHSLLHAIEEQDFQRRIEISIYLTAKIKDGACLACATELRCPCVG